jgi:hypothetical protein
MTRNDIEIVKIKAQIEALKELPYITIETNEKCGQYYVQKTYISMDSVIEKLNEKRKLLSDLDK